MRGVSISVAIITILVAFLFAYTTTGYAWTATVNNATSCKIKVKVTYGALGSQSKEDYIDPNGTKTFDTGADCPLTMYVTHQVYSNGTCNGVYSINAQRCFMLNKTFNACFHACWDTTWKIMGTTSDTNDMQRNP